MHDPLATRLSESPPFGESNRTGEYSPDTSHAGADSSARDPDCTTSAESPSAVRSADTPVTGFEILEELGRGGMGVVYRARQAKLNRIVALKMILAGDRAGERDLIRFLAEAEAIAAVRHPHVVQVFEYGESAGRPFMALEYCGGGTLAGRLKAGAIPPRESAELLSRIARGVAAAHHLGIVHRDLKPANVFFDDAGSPKVADFGLAKREAGADLTQTNAVMGTPAYMSPEQAKGETKFVGPQADVWALGVILYECLTGARPFVGDDTWTIIRAVIESEPRVPRRLVPGVPRDLELICLKCLAKDSRERYTSAGELATDLERWCAGEPVGVRPAGWLERTAKWSKRKPTLAAAYALSGVSLVLIGLATGAIWLWRDADLARGRAQSALDEAESARIGEKEAKAQVAFLNYVHAVDLALREHQANNLERARELLDACPEELRGWEWRHVHRLCHADLATLELPSTKLDGLALSPDGKRIATGAADGVPRIWNASDGTLLHELRGHTDKVTHAAFSRDGSRLVTSSDDKTARIWEVATGRFRAELKGHREFVHRAAFSPDGARVVTASFDHEARVWTVDGNLLARLVGHAGAIIDAQYSPDGARIITVSRDKTARIWGSGGELLHVLRHSTEVYGAACNPDGTRIATACHDGTAVIWDAATGKQLFALAGHAARVSVVAFSPDGRTLATGSYDNTARLWNAADGTLRSKLDGHLDCVETLVFSPDGSKLATGSWDKTIRLWETALGENAGVVLGHTDRVWDLAFSPDGGKLVSSSEDGSVRVWEIDHRERVILRGHRSILHDAEFNPDGSRIATASQDGTARIWDARSGRMQFELVGHEERIDLVQWCRDDSRLLTVSEDRTARIWDTATGRAVAVLKGHEGDIHAADISRDSRRVATASEDGSAGIWDAGTGARVHHLKHPVAVNFVEFLPGGQLIATAADDHRIRLFDVATGEPRGSLDGSDGNRMRFFEVSPDGRRIAGVADDDSVHVWDVESRERLVVLPADAPDVNAIGFSPDGSKLIVAANQGKAAIRDASTGRKLADLAGHRDDVTSARFSPDGTRVLTASRDHTARVWHADNGTLMLTLPGHEGQLLHARFNPAGDRIDTAAYLKMNDQSTMMVRIIRYESRPVNAGFKSK
jgi:WD40 repeat protein/tRNA A-37 threonylcarbamoyl transferase component Bud32